LLQNHLVSGRQEAALTQQNAAIDERAEAARAFAAQLQGYDPSGDIAEQAGARRNQEQVQSIVGQLAGLETPALVAAQKFYGDNTREGQIAGAMLNARGIQTGEITQMSGENPPELMGNRMDMLELGGQEGIRRAGELQDKLVDYAPPVLAGEGALAGARNDATVPGDVNRAVLTAEGTAPIEVDKALDIHAGTRPDPDAERALAAARREGGETPLDRVEAEAAAKARGAATGVPPEKSARLPIVGGAHAKASALEEQFFQGGGIPTFQIHDAFMNFFRSNAAQDYRQQLNVIVAVAVDELVTGNPTENDIARIKEIIFPQPGDGPDAVAAKIAAREGLVRAINGGRPITQEELDSEFGTIAAVPEQATTARSDDLLRAMMALPDWTAEDEALLSPEEQRRMQALRAGGGS